MPTQPTVTSASSSADDDAIVELTGSGLVFHNTFGQGITAAYERLGALYAEGHGLPQDFQAAADWFNRAATEPKTGVIPITRP